MKHMIYSILDAAAGAYASPWFVPHAGVALRAFTDEVNRQDEKNNLYNHSEDFALFELGIYDDSDGSFDTYDKPKLMAQAKQLKKPEVSSYDLDGRELG